MGAREHTTTFRVKTLGRGRLLPRRRRVARQDTARGERRIQVRADPAVHGPGGTARAAAAARLLGGRASRATSSAGRSRGRREEIEEFCSVTYGVTFPMFEKIEVNGSGRHPIYDELTARARTPRARPGDIQWNFEKFVLAPDGSVRRSVPAAHCARRPGGSGGHRVEPAGIRAEARRPGADARAVSRVDRVSQSTRPDPRRRESARGWPGRRSVAGGGGGQAGRQRVTAGGQRR